MCGYVCMCVCKKALGKMQSDLPLAASQEESDWVTDKVHEVSDEAGSVDEISEIPR